MSTHEDALQASRSIMKRALSEIAFFGEDEDARRIAAAALTAQQAAYADGVRAATD